MKVCVITLGCKQNKYESDCMANILKSNGYTITTNLEYADIYVLNTQQALNKFQFPVYLFFSTCLHMVWGFPGGSVVKNLPANAGDVNLILG